MMNPKMHPLLGRFDKDPGEWRPMYYGVKISVPVALNGRGSGSISLNNQPYVMTQIAHQIVGCTADPDVTGLYQDGQYEIEFKDEQSNYQNIPIMAELMYGSVRSGFESWLPYPLPYAGNKTLTFNIYNQCLRVLASEAEYFTVAIAIAGIADWGPVERERA